MPENRPSISMFSWFGYFQGARERFRIIREAGFDGVMLGWEDELEPELIPRQQLAAMARKEGLRVVNAHAPFIGWNRIWTDTPEEITDMTGRFRQWIRECGEENIPVFVVHTSDMDLEPGYSIDNGLAFYRTLAEEAERSNVKLAVENVSRQFLLREVLDHVESEAIGFCYDCSHDYMLPCGRGRLLHDYSDRIAAVHLSDNDLYLDRHWIPGEGQIPYAEIMPFLKKSPLDEISLEVLKSREDTRTPEQFCAAAARAAGKLVELYMEAALPEN
ncbi:MAG: sugar phosphate isomerase/epimerase family protein [Eubacteriaceae bacterium]|jgi:sugar phosphate isomerase/epimerase